MPEISVIIPVYKVEKYIHKCIDSVLNQSFTDFELILVDDGSPDNCGKICDEYAEKDDRIFVIHRENGGLSAARNSGIDWAVENSDSKFLTFIDSDDTVDEKYLEKLVKPTSDSQVDIVSCCINLSLESTNELIEDSIDADVVYTGREAVEHLYKMDQKVRTEACAKLYRKSLFSEIRFPEGKIHEDQFVVPILLYSARKVFVLSDALYIYYIRNGSITHGSFSAKRFDDIEAMESCEKFFILKNENDIAKMVNRKKKLFHALYTIYARKASAYKTVPRKYKMSWFKAFRTIEKSMSFDRFTWRLAQLYPKLVTPYSYWVRLLKKLKLYKDIPDW